MQTISNNKSSAYHRMMTTLFTQPVTPAADFTYDMDIHKVNATTSSIFTFFVFVSVCTCIRTKVYCPEANIVFTTHGRRKLWCDIVTIVTERSLFSSSDQKF